MKQAIIVDLDQTIALENFVGDLPSNNSREEWDNFHKDRCYYSLEHFTPILETIDVIEGYYNGFKFYKPTIIFMTAREDTHNGLIRLNSYRFIKKYFKSFNSVWDYNCAYKLLMRKENDYRPSSEVKQDMLNDVIEQGYQPLLAFDDDDENRKMFLNNGITVFQVYSKDYYNFIKGKQNE